MTDSLYLEIAGATKAADSLAKHVRSLCAKVKSLESEISSLEDDNYKLYRDNAKEQDEHAVKCQKAAEEERAMLLDELLPVIEAAWQSDSSLVDYHLRRLGIDPQMFLRATWRVA